MRRCIVTRVVNVNKSPVNDGYGLEEVSENLGQVMTIFEGHASIKHNVDFDDELVAGMVGTEVLDATDGGGEAHGEVEKQVALVGLGGESRQVADVVG